VRDVVGEELRCQPVDRVGRPRPHGYEERGRAPDAVGRVRREGDDAQNRDRGDEPAAGRVVRLAMRRRPGEQPDPRGHRSDAHHLAAADRLVQKPDAVGKHHDEACGERRLHERQRDEHERTHLGDPAAEGEAGSREPDGPPHEPDEERRPKRVLLRNLARLEGLQGDGARIQHRCHERRDNSGEDEH